MSMRDTNAAAATRLQSLLAKHRRSARGAERQLLQACYKFKRPAFIWGGRLNRFKLSLYIALLASIALPGIVAYWFNSRGLPLPGGAWNLVLPLSVIIIWPVLAAFMRSREIGRRKPIDEGAFVSGVRSEDGAIDEDSILIIRRAIAAAYCIPVELVGPVDSRACMNALSLMSKPLAIEVMADVCRLTNTSFDILWLETAESRFRDARPRTVAEVVYLVYQTMTIPGKGIGDERHLGST